MYENAKSSALYQTDLAPETPLLDAIGHRLSALRDTISATNDTLTQTYDRTFCVVSANSTGANGTGPAPVRSRADDLTATLDQMIELAQSTLRQANQLASRL